MSCAEVLDAALALRAPISLEAVNEEAALLARLDSGYAVIEIAGRRVFGYSSTYFDTPGLEQFRAHRQGRRRRFKVRTRTYLDFGLCMFEAKLKGARGETDKHRIPCSLEDSAIMNGQAQEFLTGLLQGEYGMPAPELRSVMTVDYRRGTLVNPHSKERLTLDVGLLCRDGGLGSREVAGPDLVVVETKSADGRGVADRVLAEMGIRELGMSKYCVGIALLHPHLPANRWNRVLRHRFDSERTPARAWQPGPASQHPVPSRGTRSFAWHPRLGPASTPAPALHTLVNPGAASAGQRQPVRWPPLPGPRP